MTHEGFDKLVREIEGGLGKDQALLRRHVGRLAAVGYAGLSFGFAVVVGIASLLIVPGLLWPKGAFVLLILGLGLLAIGTLGFCRAVWVRLPRPEGHELGRAEAPALFAMLDEIRGALNSTRIHHVLIIPECNAAVVQRPRLGVFGWFENYLLLGWPVLENFPAEEVRSILAHECAHLARSHGRSSQWIYRLRRSWSQILPNLGGTRARGELSFRPFIVKFVQWFWPRFDAHAFVLSRVYEHEADATAARLAGRETTATSLVRIDFYGRLLEKKFWPGLWLGAAREAEPPGGRLAARQRIPARGGARGGADVRAGFSGHDDERGHASMFVGSVARAGGGAGGGRGLSGGGGRGRGAAGRGGGIGPGGGPGGVAQARGGRVESTTQQGGGRCSAGWRGIEGTAATRAADADALWDKAEVVFQLDGQQAAAPLLRQILALQPRHAPANFALGKILLHAGDAEGEACLERAIAEDEQLLPQAGPILRAHYQRHGQTERIRELYARLDRHEKTVPRLEPGTAECLGGRHVSGA